MSMIQIKSFISHCAHDCYVRAGADLTILSDPFPIQCVCVRYCTNGPPRCWWPHSALRVCPLRVLDIAATTDQPTTTTEK